MSRVTASRQPRMPYSAALVSMPRSIAKKQDGLFLAVLANLSGTILLQPQCQPTFLFLHPHPHSLTIPRTLPESQLLPFHHLLRGICEIMQHKNFGISPMNDGLKRMGLDSVLYQPQHSGHSTFCVAYSTSSTSFAHVSG
jgi:hypothetical protein